MAKKTSSLPKKRRTREHILADLSIHHVEGYVQAYFAKRKAWPFGRTVTVYVPTANVLTEGAVQKFRTFRDNVSGQVEEVRHEE